MVSKVGILADDLTRATDGAAPLVSMGHRCVVLADHRQSPSGDAAIVSVNEAGGFGSPDVLLKSAEVLRGLRLGERT